MTDTTDLVRRLRGITRQVRSGGVAHRPILLEAADAIERLSEPTEPVAWARPDQLEKARIAPFLCTLAHYKVTSDMVPIYLHPAAPAPEPCDCGCNDPVATDPIGMLRFLSNRFKFAGVGEAVALTYARDIDKILAAPNPAPGYCKHCKQYTIEDPLPAAPAPDKEKP